MTTPKINRIALTLFGLWLLLLRVLADRLKMLDGVWLPSPIAVFQVLTDRRFLIDFAVFLLEVVVVSLLGGAIGLVLGIVLRRVEWLAGSAIRFLRLGMWLPFFMAWAFPILPFWRLRPARELDQALLLELLLNTVVAVIPAVIFAACYYYLTVRRTYRLSWQDARGEVVRHIVLHALLLSLLWQLFMQPYGWRWFPDPTPVGIARGAATTVLFIGLMALITWVTRFNLEKTRDGNAIAALHGIRGSNKNAFIGASVWLIGFFLLWDRMAALLEERFVIPKPFPVAMKGYDLLVRDSELWVDIGVSSVEIVVGITITATMALILIKALCLFGAEKILSRGLLIINAVPLIMSLLMMPIIGINIWLKAIIIASLSVYPFVQSLWVLRNRQPICRLLLALDNALPYAFVGMLFGEAWASTAGLGFTVVRSQYSDRTAALAVSLIALGLMVIASCIFRAVIKKLYLWEANTAVDVAQTT